MDTEGCVVVADHWNKRLTHMHTTTVHFNSHLHFGSFCSDKLFPIT